jgi:hypothetical protein
MTITLYILKLNTQGVKTAKSELLSPLFPSRVYDTFFAREVRDRSLHRRRQHAVNTVLAAWKMLLYVVLFLALVPALRPVEGIGQLFQVKLNSPFVILSRPPPPLPIYIFV